MATYTLRICDIAFPRPQWLRERASTLRYTYITCHTFRSWSNKYDPLHILQGGSNMTGTICV